MKLSIKDGAVLKDGKAVGALGAEGKFLPAGRMARKTIEAIEKQIAAANPPPAHSKPKEPPYNPAAGDKDPEFIEWYLRHHTPEEFAARYPEHRKVERPNYFQ